MKLQNADILQLLPQFMRDDAAVQALASAVNKLISEPGGKVFHLREWDQIDTLSSEELDELAWEMSIEWYDTGMDLENKRAMIKAATLLKEKSGTKWAVIEAVKNGYGSEPEISEWFEYEGDPGHFKAKINASKGFDFSKVLAAIEYVKRASAHLDEIEMETTEKMEIFVGFSTVVINEYRTAMTKEDFTAFEWLVDESSDTLMDELGAVIIE
ncbi:MAG: phage tail protein I [Paludibacteraceae bacterium]|nr:phage tail protein I [Paludibacteraceae bacterium]